jgi:Kef-type K+ transport system membrane component KefB
MGMLQRVPRNAVRALAAGLVGAALIVIGLAALGAPDPGSQLGVFPLLTVGGMLSATACGVGVVALMRFRRSRKLPRAIVVQR